MKARLNIPDLQKRLSALHLGAVADALYEMHLPEQVLPSSLRPLSPDTIVVGEAYTVQGREIVPPVGWDVRSPFFSFPKPLPLLTASIGCV